MEMRVIWTGLWGVVAGFLICAFVVYPPHSGWDQSVDLPAWVQAVGSIAAIVAAGRIAGRQERVSALLREKDKIDAAARARIEARDHAIEIAPAMLAWDQSLAISRFAIMKKEALYNWGNIGRVAENASYLLLPEPVVRLAGNYRALGPAAGAMQDAVVARDVLKMRENVVKQLWAKRHLHGVDSVTAEEIEPILVMIERFCDAVTLATIAVVSLRDGR